MSIDNRNADRIALLESPLFFHVERRWTGDEWGCTGPTHEVYRVGLRHPDPNRGLVVWTDDHSTAAEAIDAALLMVDTWRGGAR